jgi:hypothetical protein
MCGIPIGGKKRVRTGSGRGLAYAPDIAMLGYRSGDYRRTFMDPAAEKSYSREAFDRHLEFVEKRLANRKSY